MIEDSEPLHGSFAGDHHASGFAENGEHTAVTDGKSGEEFLTTLCARYGIGFDQAMGIMEDVEEHLAVRPHSGSGFSSAHRVASMQTMFVQMLGCSNAPLALRAMCYALELDDVIGNKDAAGIGRELGCSRYNVTKLIDRFQVALKLPKRIGQKSEAACHKMSVKRKSQLTAETQRRRE